MKVSQVFESVVAELNRAKGVTFRILLEIQAESDGFPKDVEDDVLLGHHARSSCP
ncbi:hypothetical protein [Mesorhizobium sp. Cs1299R1N3]|uniref:hypothetical protein n=1 Tax=Mesorhizobium sp. Cs1299R1N3 TaxID=3015173 RepID=UPI00301DCDD6